MIFNAERAVERFENSGGLHVNKPAALLLVMPDRGLERFVEFRDVRVAEREIHHIRRLDFLARFFPFPIGVIDNVRMRSPEKMGEIEFVFVFKRLE